MSAARRLAEAFGTRRRPLRSGAVRIGVFGDDVPEPLLAAHRAAGEDIRVAPLDAGIQADPIVDRVAEPFLDQTTRQFLDRLARGDFADHAALVFCRDDAAALVAYQYALELRRQGLIPGAGPRLILWNLLHAASAAVENFNLKQLEKFQDEVRAVTGRAHDAAAFVAACSTEARRAAALSGLAGRVDPETEFIWRNAGRWLDACTHADLVTEALADAAAPASGLTIALAGTLVDDPALYAMLGRIGRVTIDLTPMGQRWPQADWSAETAPDLVSILARPPLHPRFSPPTGHGQAMRGAVTACDLLVTQVAPNDDSFGWMIPSLAQAMRDAGKRAVHLGFMPHRPDPDWLTEAEARIRQTLEARQ